ncbi:MAG: hypothetical protein IKY82_08385 [Alistipes sp.]|nr:hypothetical protein [Alistipes sp.]
MFRILAIILLGVLTSFYFFPFEFAILPGANTKMVMAGVSLIVLAMNLAKNRRASINKDFLNISLIACLMSLTGLASVAYNETNDYTYTTYIISMWVWLGGAYLVISCMRWLHEKVSVSLVANYLIVVCVAQCIIALLIDNYPAVYNFVHTYIAGFDWVGFEQLEKGGRLYGIGAALDVAGLRFSTVLAMIAYLSVKSVETSNHKLTIWYLLAFIIITIVGNMMARTTIVGVALSCVYWLYASKEMDNTKVLWYYIIGLGCVTIAITTFLYSNNPIFKEDIRFAFEGFFSLVETGKWDVSSNEMLKNMYVFPDNLKTWGIGDGYIENPYSLDPYYTGRRWGGYYMGTDVGYLRFIFYFGVIGLALFISFFCKTTQICIKRFQGYRVLFLMIVAVNFIVWFKVATDIFVVFALFLCIGEDENESEDEVMLHTES